MPRWTVVRFTRVKGIKYDFSDILYVNENDLQLNSGSASIIGLMNLYCMKLGLDCYESLIFVLDRKKNHEDSGMSFKIAVVQFRPIIGDLGSNLSKHIEYIKRAEGLGADLVVFPELSLTGYNLQDLTSEVALHPDDELLEPLLEKSREISICVGAVELSEEYFIYNSSFFIEDGKVLNITRKIYPPTYGVFQEKRFFAQGRSIKAFDSRFGRFGVMICNDARHPAIPYVLALDGAKYIITQAAVPARGFPKKSKPDPVLYFENGNVFYSGVFGIYSIFANLAGYEEGLIFTGNSMVIAPGGRIVAEAPLFEEAIISVEVSEDDVRLARSAVPIFGEEDISITLEELSRINRLWRK